MKRRSISEVKRFQELAGIVAEEEVIDLDTGGGSRGEEYQDAISEYIDECSSYFNEFSLNDEDYDSLEELLDKEGKLLFIIYKQGIDPEADGSEAFYSLQGNQEALDEVASMLAEVEDFNMADLIHKGEEPVICIFKSIGSGITVDPDASITSCFTLTTQGAQKVKEAAKRLKAIEDQFPEK